MSFRRDLFMSDTNVVLVMSNIYVVSLTHFNVVLLCYLFFLILSTTVRTLDENWLESLRSHSCNQLNIPEKNRPGVMADFKEGHLKVHKHAAVVTKLFPFYEYLKQNYREMSPSTVLYFRKCIHVFIMNDSMNLHHDNGGIVCQDCCNYNNIATDTSNKRKALILKVNKLLEQCTILNTIDCQKMKTKKELIFANEHLIDSQELYHECYLQCLILKPLLPVSKRKNKTINAKDMLFDKFKKLLTNSKRVVERIELIFECAKQALTQNDQTSDDEDNNDESKSSISVGQIDFFETEPDYNLDNV